MSDPVSCHAFTWNGAELVILEIADAPPYRRRIEIPGKHVESVIVALEQAQRDLANELAAQRQSKISRWRRPTE